MQTSNQQDYVQSHTDFEIQANEKTQLSPDDHSENLIFSLMTLAGFAVVSLWIMQNSVNAYYQQTYHRANPMMALEQFEIWRMGGKVGDFLYQQLAQITSPIDETNQRIVAQFNHDYAYTEEYKLILAEKARQEKILLAKQAAAREKQALLDQFSLSKNDQVFFAGDSLMQGVAPYVQQQLHEKYEIKTVNLSKQSTGLAYPKFFDWPQTIENTLKNNPNIKILVVFLGPNDPWDMPSLQGGAYLRFKSPEWEAEYRSRIARIIQTAQQHQVSVMWLTPPNMRKDSLNKQMIFLNHVVSDEVKKHKAFAIDSRPILGSQNNVYSDYLNQDQKNIKTRSADGIHFSPEGQREIARIITSHLKIVQ